MHESFIDILTQRAADNPYLATMPPQLCLYTSPTVIAGGDPANFRNCYLKYNINLLDESPNKYDHNQEGHAGDDKPYPEVSLSTGQLLS